MGRTSQDRVVVITGAGSGLGREMALQFAARGDRLFLTDVNEVALPETAALIHQRGGQAETYVADMANWDQVQALAAHLTQRYGRPDVWINNAAVSVYGDFADIPMAETRRVIEVNLLGYAHGLNVAIEQMGRAGGTIICVTSNLAWRSIPLQSAYCASKHGIDGLIESVRVELIRAGLPIALCQVLPVGIDTTFFALSKTRTGYAPDVPGQVLDPGRVARAVVTCAEHPQRDVPVGGQAVFLRWAALLVPGLLDRYMARYTYPQQISQTPRSPEAPNDLFGSPHLPGAIRGGHPGRRLSPVTWAMQHRRWVAAGLLGTAAAVYGWRHRA